jgi:hypothetical protein
MAVYEPLSYTTLPVYGPLSYMVLPVYEPFSYMALLQGHPYVRCLRTRAVSVSRNTSTSTPRILLA